MMVRASSPPIKKVLYSNYNNYVKVLFRKMRKTLKTDNLMRNKIKQTQEHHGKMYDRASAEIQF